MWSERVLLTLAILMGLWFVWSTARTFAAELVEGFEGRVYQGGGGRSLLYRLLKPEGFDEADGPTGDRKYPLLIFLHGAGERGSDNAGQLKWGSGLLRRAADEHAAFVVVPQCPVDEKWMDVDWSKSEVTLPDAPSPPMALLLELLPKLMEEFPIDENRVYVGGLSMGGMGTWDLIQRHPDRFAAAFAICGGGDVSRADRVKDLPVWIFHGAEDSVVPVEQSRNMVAALKELDSPVRYSEYPGVGHHSWSRAFKEEKLLPWLFSQRRELEQKEKAVSHLR